MLEYSAMTWSGLPLTLLILCMLHVGGFAQVRFEDVTQAAGIQWTHDNGETPEKRLIETMGGGGAFLDFNNDGKLDIYLVNSGAHEKSGRPSKGTNALYRKNGDGTFTDVAEKANAKGYGTTGGSGLRHSGEARIRDGYRFWRLRQ